MSTAKYAAAALLALAVAACTTGTGLVVDDPEPPIDTQVSTIAYRFEEARRTGGMAGVIQSVQDCYHEATVPFTKIWALRECIVLDDQGYRMDVSVGRQVFHSPNPFYADAVYRARSWRYAQMDGFTSLAQLLTYQIDANTAVKAQLAQLDQNPIIIHHPLRQQLDRNPFTGISHMPLDTP